MKKLILSLLFLGFISTAQTQILLDVADLGDIPASMKIDPGTNSLVIQMKEKSAGEFNKDALTFVKNRFDSRQLVKDNKEGDFDSYVVKFKSSKGHLTANFDDKGDLVSSFQRFTNVAIPDEARLQILQKYRDCNFLKSTYAASSKGYEIKKGHYLVKIKDGDKMRRVRINQNAQGVRLAGF